MTVFADEIQKFLDRQVVSPSVSDLFDIYAQAGDAKQSKISSLRASYQAQRRAEVMRGVQSTMAGSTTTPLSGDTGLPESDPVARAMASYEPKQYDGLLENDLKARELRWEKQGEMAHAVAMRNAIKDRVMALNPRREDEQPTEGEVYDDPYISRVWPEINKLEMEMGVPRSAMPTRIQPKGAAESLWDALRFGTLDAAAMSAGGVLSAVGSAGDALAAAADAISGRLEKNSRYHKQLKPLADAMKKLAVATDVPSEALQDAGADLFAAMQEIDQWHPSLAASEDEKGWKPWEPNWYIRNGTKALVQLGEMMLVSKGASALSGGSKAAAMAGFVGTGVPMEFGGAYADAVESGASRGEAARGAFVYTIASSLLEFLPAKVFAGGTTKRGLAKAILGFMTEGGTESAQELAQMITLEHVSGVPAEDVESILKRVSMAFMFGGLAGGTMSIFTPSIDAAPTKKEIEQHNKQAAKDTEESIEAATAEQPKAPSKKQQEAMDKAERAAGSTKEETVQETKPAEGKADEKPVESEVIEKGDGFEVAVNKVVPVEDEEIDPGEIEIDESTDPVVGMDEDAEQQDPDAEEATEPAQQPEVVPLKSAGRNQPRARNRTVGEISSEFATVYEQTVKGGKAWQANQIFDNVIYPFSAKVADRLGISVEESLNRVLYRTVAEDNDVNKKGQKFRGYYQLSTGTIGLTKNADAGTVVHEFFHAGFGLLDASEQSALIEWAKGQSGNVVEDGHLNLKGEEILARAFERYVMEGSASEDVLPILQKIRQFMLDFMRYAGLDSINLSDDARAVFDSMLGAERELAFDGNDPTVSFERGADESHLYSTLADEAEVRRQERRKQTDTPEFNILYDSIVDDLQGVDNDGMKEAQKGVTSTLSMREQLGRVSEFFRRDFGRGRWSRLPRTKQFGAARETLSKLEVAYNNASKEVVEALGNVFDALKGDEGRLHLFTQKVFHDNIQIDIDAGKEVPFYKDPDPAKRRADFEANKKRIDDAVAADPFIQRALKVRKDMWKGFRRDYVAAYEKLGIKREKALNNEDYFRHQVIEYAKAKDFVRFEGDRVKMDPKRGWLKERKGTDKAINLNYAQAELEVLAQFRFDTKAAQGIRELLDTYDKLPELRLEAAALTKYGTPTDWRELVPEGHVAYRIREGLHLFTAHGLRPAIATKLIEGTLSEAKISDKDIKEIMGVAGGFDPIVIPKELAEQLDNMRPPTVSDSVYFDLYVRKPTRWWKKIRLLAPTSFAKYNIRNFSELDRVLAYAPGTFNEVPSAARELLEVYLGRKAPSGMLKEWMDLGGNHTLMTGNELNTDYGMQAVSQLQRKIDRQQASLARKAAMSPRDAAEWYWNHARKLTDLRESLFRYAAYRRYKKDIDANGGMPSKKPGLPRYGVSNPADIEGAISNEYKAFKMSADLLGDYGDLTPFGSTMRDSLVPFIAFQETNLKSWYRGIANILHDEASMWKLGKAVGKSVGIRAPLAAARLGGWYMLASAFTSSMQAWNRLMFPELEDELPVEERRRAHMIFGKNDDGEIVYFGRLGTMTDITEWFGGLPSSPFGPFGSIYARYEEIANGHEHAADLFWDPASKVYNSINPFVKAPFEVATRSTGYPKVNEQRRIKYVGDYVSSMFGFREEYLAVTRSALADVYNKTFPEDMQINPRAKSYGYLSPKRLMKLFLYTSKENAADFYEILGRSYEFAHEELGYPKMSADSRRVNYAREAVKAARYGDYKAFEGNMAMYLQAGGSAENWADSLLRSLDPLAGLPGKEAKARFLLSMTEQEKQKLEGAIMYAQTEAKIAAEFLATKQAVQAVDKAARESASVR